MHKEQTSSEDNKNISDSDQLDKVEKPDNENNFCQNTSLSLLKTVPSVPQFQSCKLDISQVLGVYVAFDLEWDESKDNTIEAVSFVDGNGNSDEILLGTENA